VPSRLIGERLRLHLYDDRIEAFLGAAPAVTLPRLHARAPARTRCIKYRHVIGALVRKPQAFRAAQWRDERLPTPTYHAIWQHLDTHLEARAACKHIVGILAVAAQGDCAQALGDYLLERFAADDIPALHALQHRFAPAAHSGRPLTGGETQHPLHAYDRLLPSLEHAAEAH
jgi:hypothetical protein